MIETWCQNGLKFKSLCISSLQLSVPTAAGVQCHIQTLLAHLDEENLNCHFSSLLSPFPDLWPATLPFLRTIGCRESRALPVVHNL